jgi:hypothetical protein
VRAALPFAVLTALIGWTVTAHELQEADPADPTYLSPVSSTDDGGSELARRLRERGVAVERVTDVAAALTAARQPGSTLFVTAPAMVRPASMRTALDLPPGTRVVLVTPGATVLSTTGLPVRAASERWATAVTSPDCTEPVAVAAGRAAARRESYVSGQFRFACYQGGLAEISTARATVTLAGAADPFRNDRIAEHGNAALAVGLLTRGTRVVWLDVHTREPLPFRNPSGDPTPKATEDEQPGGTEQPTPVPGLPGDGADDEPDPRERDEDAPPPSAAPPSLLDAFPPSLWAALLMILLAVTAFVVASARRLGSPVPEPLPVRVRATETVHGRGALYRRARARGPSLDVLRAAARHRLLELLRLPPDLSTEDLAQAVAAHTGRDPEHLRALFTGPDPDSGEAGDDQRFVTDAVTLQQIVDQVAGPAPRPAVPNEGEPW